jgi:hypothetical protein
MSLNHSTPTSLEPAPAQGGTYLLAGPAAASPPLVIAIALVALSIAAPFIFVADGTPSLLLGICALTVALAGLLTMLAAIRAQTKRRADAAIRRRVSITAAGITLHPTPAEADNLHFPWDAIENARLMPAAFILHASDAAPRPGRHGLRFGKLVTPREDLLAALTPRSRQPEERP